MQRPARSLGQLSTKVENVLPIGLHSNALEERRWVPAFGKFTNMLQDDTGVYFGGCKPREPCYLAQPATLIHPIEGYAIAAVVIVTAPDFPGGVLEQLLAAVCVVAHQLVNCSEPIGLCNGQPTVM